MFSSRLTLVGYLLCMTATGILFVGTYAEPELYEIFDETWTQRWRFSEATKHDQGELMKYDGRWAVEPAKVLPVNASDSYLVVKSPARLHAIATKLKQPMDFMNDFKDEFVFQYELKLQEGLTCGGAYIKLLSADPNFKPELFDDRAPYTIMFGPDHCGATNKVHFILRHKNPINGEAEEKHLSSPPKPLTDTKATVLYTLVVRKDNTFEIYINKEKSASGSLLDSFKPPINPPKEIDDPTDSKPADWVDEAMIPDPAAVKPDDWDESQPFEVPNMSVEKPDDWLDDEPLMIPDPAALKPADWSDEEDGEWVAPLVPNPKCAEAAGCGEWKRPMMRNPLYKGPWSPPMINNPAYQGPWAPRKIPNPAYFEDLTPYKMTPVGAIGIELWTMNAGISFDNIYLGWSLHEAFALAERDWRPKHTAETALEGTQEAPWGQELFNKIVSEITVFLEKVGQDPVQAVKQHWEIALGIVVIPMLIVFILAGLVSMCCGSGSSDAPAAEEQSHTEQATASGAENNDSNHEEEKESESKKDK